MPFRLFLEELRFFYLEYTESSGGQHIAYFVFVTSARSSVFLLSRPRIEMIIFASGLVELVAVTICIKCLFIIFQLVEISYRAILLTMKSECLSNVYLYLFHNRFLLLATCTSGLTQRQILHTKIVKGESRGKWKTKFSTFDYAEPHPIFYKDSERREQRRMENKVFNV